MPYFKVDALEDFDQTVQTVPAYVGNPNFGLGHNIGHSVGWVERSETQQLIGVGFRSSTQPTGNSYGLTYDQGLYFERRKERNRSIFYLGHTLLA